MRTFRFMSGDTLTEAQQQTISCEVYLEASDNVHQEQAADCSCFTEDECIRQDGNVIRYKLTNMIENT